VQSASLETKLFCETSAVSELDNIKNGAILRESSIFAVDNVKTNYFARRPQIFKLTTSQTKQFCDTSFKNGKLNAQYGFVPIFFAFFPFHLSKVCEVLHLSRKIT